MADNETKPANTPSFDSSRYRYIYVRKSVERRVQRRKLATIFLVFIMISLLLTGTVYAVLAFVDNNNFRITVDRGRGVLTLSEEATFSRTTTQLTTRGPSEMTDMTFSFLPFLQFRTMDGSYGWADTYYASSFYLSNLGDDPCEYRELITITDTYNLLEDCIRVLIIREEMQLDSDGNFYQASLNDDFSHMHWACYAKAREDGSAEQVAYNNARDGGILSTVVDPNPDAVDKVNPWMCTNFVEYTAGNASEPVYISMDPHARMRYTLCIWIEGTDPDTVDARIGGRISMRFGFSTLSEEEQTIS